MDLQLDFLLLYLPLQLLIIMKTKPRSTVFAILILLFISISQVQAQTNPETVPPPPAQETSKQKANETDEVRIFEKVEIEASVNLAQWRNHLQKKLVPYIEKAARKKMKVGQYTVNVKFLVERDGSISNVQALDDPGYGLAEGAVKVVRTGPKWTPGEINGRKVRSYHTQPITFQIQEQ